MNSQDRPLVSVVVSLYNHEKYIEAAIKSVLAQTYKNTEIIVVDDGSTDDGAKIVQSMAEKFHHIRLIKNPKNLGTAASRNIGVHLAKGRLLCFLDSDDLWRPDKLEKQVPFTLSNGYAFTFTAYSFANENGEIIGSTVKVPEKINYRQALKNHTIWTSTVMIDLNQLNEKAILMPMVRKGQDTATWWKILKTVEYAYSLPEPLSIYRQVPHSLSSNKLKAMRRTWHLFRSVENLSFAKSAYYFFFYAFHALKRRL